MGRFRPFRPLISVLQTPRDRVSSDGVWKPPYSHSNFDPFWRFSDPHGIYAYGFYTAICVEILLSGYPLPGPSRGHTASPRERFLGG